MTFKKDSSGFYIVLITAPFYFIYNSFCALKSFMFALNLTNLWNIFMIPESYVEEVGVMCKKQESQFSLV